MSAPVRFLFVAGLLAGDGWLWVAAGEPQLKTTTASATADANKNASELDGTWKLLSVEQEGEETARDDDVRWVINDGQILYAGEPLAAMMVYAAFTPKGIDLSFREPNSTYEGIYVIGKEDLKICLNTRTTAPKERPSDFATNNKSNLRVLKFERVDPSAAGTSLARGYIGIALAVQNDKVVIQDVLEKSPAEKAGLRADDVILTLGDQPARDLLSTVESVRRQTPGSDLTIRILRDGQEKDFTLRVAIFPFSLLGILG
jgi:uncharacterized protein (TIGR03067 family)